MVCENSLSPEIVQPSKSLIVFTGPTASGKDTIMNLFLKYHPYFQRIVPYTTRPAHANERDGWDCNFITEPGFKKRQQEFCAVLERQLTNGIVYYGTSIAQVRQVLDGQPKIWKLDLETACNLRPNLQNFFNPKELNLLLEKSAIVYLGVERLTVLKDRLRKRARPDDVSNIFLPRLRQEWNCWQRLKKNFDPVICDLNTQTPEEIMKMIEDRLIS